MPVRTVRVLSLVTSLGRIVPIAVPAFIGTKVGAWTGLRGAATTLA